MGEADELSKATLACGCGENKTTGLDKELLAMLSNLVETVSGFSILCRLKVFP